MIGCMSAFSFGFISVAAVAECRAMLLFGVVGWRGGLVTFHIS